MSKDAILMNASIKLMELNTITLAKMKDYVSKNIDSLKDDASTSQGIDEANASMANAEGVGISSVSGVSGVSGVSNGSSVSNGSGVSNGSSVSGNGNEIGYSKADVLTNEELLIRVKEYENNRVITNTILTNIESYTDPTIADSAASIQPQDTIANTVNYIPEIMEKVLTSINKNVNVNASIHKKTLIINSYNRDWINNPMRNKLSFTINIDLQNNIIEPLKILFPAYVKQMTPYITMVVTDNHKTFKYSFLFSSTSGKWDIWKLITEGENINNQINLANKNWKIQFLDYIGNELNLGTDNIKIGRVREAREAREALNNNKAFDTNIDNILEAYTNASGIEKTKGQNHDDVYDMYEIIVDYSNLQEYDEYNLNTVSKYDYMLLKTHSNTMVNIKVIDVADANANADAAVAAADPAADPAANAAGAAGAGADVIKKIIISNEANLKKDDLLNSSLLNYGAQYSLILTYYPRRNIT
jgi:hypothetical protein